MEIIKPTIQFDDYGNWEIIQGTVSHTYPLHIHNAVCFGIITDGIAAFYCQNKKMKILKKGDTFFVPRGTPHTLAAINGRVYSYCTVCLKYSDAPFCNDEFLYHAYSYIFEMTEATFSIEEMAKHMCYSKYYLIHRFKKKCGLSPYQLYMNIRIAKIKQGVYANEPLLDLVHQYGFSHQSHLNNTFKKHVGISPKQYQKSYRVHTSAGENVANI